MRLDIGMTMRIKSLVAASLVAAALLLSPANAEEETISVGSLAVTMPNNWYETTIPQDEVDTRRIIVSNDSEEEQAIMMISVVPREGRTLAEMNSETRRYIAGEMDGVLEYERATNLNGARAHLFVYEGRSEHNEQGRRKFMRAVVERGDDFYILHGVADHVPFANHAGTMEDIVNSVSWK